MGFPADAIRPLGLQIGLAATCVVVMALSSGAANAYRPFDGTDAAVAEQQNLEIELGPTEYMREGDAPVLRHTQGKLPPLAGGRHFGDNLGDTNRLTPRKPTESPIFR